MGIVGEKDKPRFKAVLELESEFKTQYALLLKNSVKILLKINVRLPDNTKNTQVD